MTWPIEDIAARLGLVNDDIEPYGKYLAKINLDILQRPPRPAPNHYIVMTSMSPTPFGEGKTTVAIGLATC